MKTIQAGMTLKARSICDHDCIFSVKVVARKGNWAVIETKDATRRCRIKTDSNGNEYIMPERYSMAPAFYGQEVAK